MARQFKMSILRLNFTAPLRTGKILLKSSLVGSYFHMNHAKHRASECLGKLKWAF